MRTPQNLKNLPPFLELLSSVKTKWIFYQIFVAFSEYLNLKAWKHMYVQECSFRWKFNPIVNPLGICFCLFFKYHLLSPKHLAQRNFYCNSRKFYPSYVQHATNCWISCNLPSFSLFHTFSKLHLKLFIDKPNVRSNFQLGQEKVWIRLHWINWVNIAHCENR